VALGSQIVDLGRPHLLDDPDQAGAVGEIAVVELEADIGFMQVAVEMVDAPGVEDRGASPPPTHGGISSATSTSTSPIVRLKTRIEQFIAYFNAAMANPFRRTYAGKALVG
jgi:hypothetical protein